MGLSHREYLGGGSLLLIWRLIHLHGWAGAHEVLIAIDVIDPGDARPEFGLRFYEGLWRREKRGVKKFKQYIYTKLISSSRLCIKCKMWTVNKPHYQCWLNQGIYNLIKTKTLLLSNLKKLLATGHETNYTSYFSPLEGDKYKFFKQYSCFHRVWLSQK